MLTPQNPLIQTQAQTTQTVLKKPKNKPFGLSYCQSALFGFYLERLAGLLVLTLTLKKHLANYSAYLGIHLNTHLNKQACLGLLSQRVVLLPLLLSMLSLYYTASHATQPTLTNSLHGHPSPYLAMHGQDPVHWQDWSADVLTRAKESGKPILVSSGYFACHWCHVMQQESYLNATAAEQMNQNFIAVKIDRELHPDLDHYLIEFARSLTGRAGWPQHVVLTPQGYPFAAFGYLPTENYVATLNNIHKGWLQQPANIIKLAKQASATASNKLDQPITANEFQSRLLEAITPRMDDLSGGLTGSHKFPESPLLLTLLQIEALSENQQAWLEFTLEQMQSQHLIDHIHGGFYRYTVDPEWQIPHFEKMGYDNALITQLYFKAGQVFERKDFIETGKQTLRYMETHLYSPKIGLFASSQSALNSAGVEGGDYLFSKQQLKNRLPKPAFKHVTEAWQLNSSPPYEEGWHPMPTANYWHEIKNALQTPVTEIPKDRKHILSWNGLALSAYATAYQVTGETVYLTHASSLAKRLTHLVQQPKAPRAIDNLSTPIGLATLEDYAYIIRGLTSLKQALQPNDNSAIKNATNQALQQLNSTAQTLFLNESGWQTNQTFSLPAQNREAALMDDAIPSASAILECAVTDSLMARNQLFSRNLRQTPLSYPSYLSALRCSSQEPPSH